MQRYFLKECNYSIEINSSDEIYYHLSKVLRARVGDDVEFCDVSGKCFQYKINAITASTISFEQIKEIASSSELPKKVILAISYLKNNNFELVLQKAVEIGVSDIIAFESKRTIVKANNFNSNKFTRFEKIILEASEQSKRNYIPHIHKMSFNELAKFDCSNKLVAFEACSADGSNLLINNVDIDKDTLIVIGPEGGFEESEIDHLKSNDFKVISLGKRILRAETAAINSCSIISAVLESKGGE